MFDFKKRKINRQDAKSAKKKTGMQW